MIATVLAHPNGGSKAVPTSAHLVPFLNKAEDEANLAVARETARLLLHASSSPQIDSVVIGAALASDPVAGV
jgi:hypothetical protein